MIRNLAVGVVYFAATPSQAAGFSRLFPNDKPPLNGGGFGPWSYRAASALIVDALVGEASAQGPLGSKGSTSCRA
jgi:hypothetical protein